MHISAGDRWVYDNNHSYWQWPIESYYVFRRYQWKTGRLFRRTNRPKREREREVYAPLRSMELSPHRPTAANAHSESTQATGGQSQQIRSARGLKISTRKPQEFSSSVVCHWCGVWRLTRWHQWSQPIGAVRLITKADLFQLLFLVEMIFFFHNNLVRILFSIKFSPAQLTAPSGL